MIQHPDPVVTTMSGIVEKVNSSILAKLQEANGSILSVGYMYGHPLELVQTLKEKTENPGVAQPDGSVTGGKFDMFPVVMLFTDIVSKPSKVRGLFKDVNLDIVIAMNTDPTLKAADREAKNFVPILRPIYYELINQIVASGAFWVQSQKQILGYDTDRYYWGKTGIYGNTGNQFNDYLDASEIKGLPLTINYKNQPFQR